ncbi:MAG: NAD(P)/FAD-dependent oxidoreductase [Spirochaetales bacterium]|nr:NAD(P)/FAD-dependent oxidoreductase [Spirochaetales bacterium]
MAGKREYGLIVIGAGMTGLSTALAWAETHDLDREPVLVLEKEPAPGGCVTTFAREGYRFDTVQIIPDISDLLKFYRIPLDLVPYGHCLARLFLADPVKKDVRVYPVLQGRENFRDYLVGLFPEEEEGLNRFFDYGQKLLDELEHLKTEPTPLQGLAILIKCPGIIRQSGRTYRQYLDSFRFRNPDLMEILDLFSSFSGLSGDRCAALLTACAAMTTLQGSYRPRSGFISFPHSLRKALETRGGEILTGLCVDRILHKEGRVQGVRCGEEIFRASRVVCTADTHVMVEEMLGLGPVTRERVLGPVKGWFKKYARVKSAPSSFTVHLGLDEKLDLKGMGFDCGYNVLTTGRAAHEKAFDLWEKGERLTGEEEFHMAVISPSALIGGKQTLIIHVTPAAAEDWEELRAQDYDAYRARKKEAARYYIDKVEEYMIPGLKEHIRLTDISTPATYARYLGTKGGANSDMLNVPSNFGMYRLPTRTPVEGLFLPKFSNGIWPSLMAGLQVVDMMTGGAVMEGRSRYVHRENQLSFFFSMRRKPSAQVTNAGASRV